MELLEIIRAALQHLLTDKNVFAVITFFFIFFYTVTNVRANGRMVKAYGRTIAILEERTKKSEQTITVLQEESRAKDEVIWAFLETLRQRQIPKQNIQLPPYLKEAVLRYMQDREHAPSTS